MVKLCLLLALLCGTCSCSRILVFYPGASGSLLHSFNQLFKELSHRGHEVTVVTAYDLPGIKDNNITQIVLGHSLDIDELKKMMSLPLLHQIYYLWDINIFTCKEFLENPKMKEFINSNKTYDLFIGSPFYYLECSLAVAHHLNLPILNLFSNRMQIHFSHLTKQFLPYSYITEFNLPFSNNMNFWQRTVNTVFCLCYSLGLSVYYIPQMNAIVKQHFPHIPPIEEMLSEVPVTLMNTNIAVHPAQPLLPGVISVGGLTIPQNTKLPEEIQEWMDAGDQGVILFSLGSNIKMVALDPVILKVVLAVFDKLPQRVLMKWEADNLDGKPDNVKIAKWIPQAAVLAHQHCNLFMTHGGLHSWMEAVYFSVPLLGLRDTFLDQTHNLAEMQERGHGIHFTGPWTEDHFHRAIVEVLHNPKYKENIWAASRVFRDQPMSPLQTAVYWTEYVIRHKGAPHLQSASSSLSWYQLVLLDVVTLLVMCAVIAAVFTCVVLRCLKKCAVNYGYIMFTHTLRFSDSSKIKIK